MDPVFFESLPVQHLIWIPILFILVVTGVIFLIVSLLEKRRRRALQQAAVMHGYQFFPKPEFDVTLEKFKVGSKGHGKRVRNLITGSKKGVHFSLFDYRYTVGGGKSNQTYNQTVIRVPAPGPLPAFILAPEHFFSRIGAALGMQDIDFDEDKAFSDAYVLKGEDEAAIRTFFSQGLRRALTVDKPYNIESDGAELLIYRSNRKMKPEVLTSTVMDAFTILDALPQSK